MSHAKKECNPTIALVDNYSPMRKFIADYLSKQGFDVVCESDNGEDFIKYLLRAKALPDLCLLDLIMPKLDGYETARRLKAYYPQIRILAYSSCEFPDEVERILRCGAHGYFSKGNDLADLKKALFGIMPAAAPMDPFFDLIYPVIC